MKEEFPIEDDWLAFELRPETPAEGVPITTLFSEKVLQERLRELRIAGEPFGLVFGDRRLLPNSNLSLRAAESARDQGVFDQFHELVFKAYFTDGLNIGDTDVIASIGKEAGVEADDLKNVMSTGAYQERLDRARREAREMGIVAIPAFVLEDGSKIVGARPTDVFRKAFAEAESRSPS